MQVLVDETRVFATRHLRSHGAAGERWRLITSTLASCLRTLRRKLMELKKTCGICGRSYKVGTTQIGIDEWCLGIETSHVQIKLRESDTTTFLGKDICTGCAKKLLNYVLKLKREAPKKCFWCEHDFGPNHPNYRKGCEGCGSNYSAFQLKKRMSPHQLAEWKYYNGEE